MPRLFRKEARKADSTTGADARTVQTSMDAVKRIPWDAADRRSFAFELVAGASSGSLVSESRQLATVDLALKALMEKVPGDFVETGAYNGGTTMLLAKVLDSMAPADKLIWTADSFAGLPTEDVAKEQGAQSRFQVAPDDVLGNRAHIRSQKEGQVGEYSSSRAAFDANLRTHGFDKSPRIRVLEGWFNETLPTAPISSISFLRLDGDLYVSTMDALKSLYHKVSPGGYIYVDDFGSYAGCRAAVKEFRAQNDISVPMRPVYDSPDGSYEAVWWQKEQLAEKKTRDIRDLESQFVSAADTGSLVSEPRQLATVDLAVKAIMANVAGDFVETGAYNGGTTILMSKILNSMAPPDKLMWSADSFAGLPTEDVASEHLAQSVLQAVPDHVLGKRSHISAEREGQVGEYPSSRAVFDENLRRHGLDGSPRIRVLQGWFNETLPTAPISSISFLRLDGDIFVSTMDALENLYHKVSPGGYIYVDDYGSYAGCKAAVKQFRARHHISVPMVPVYENADGAYEAVWWQKK